MEFDYSAWKSVLLTHLQEKIAQTPSSYQGRRQTNIYLKEMLDKIYELEHEVYQLRSFVVPKIKEVTDELADLLKVRYAQYYDFQKFLNPRQDVHNSWPVMPADPRITKFLDDGADPEVPLSGYSALYLASSINDAWTVEQLIKHGGRPDGVNWDEHSPENGKIIPLVASTSVKGIETVEVLLRHGADLTKTEGTIHLTALQRAADIGAFDIVRLLASHGAKPTPQVKKALLKRNREDLYTELWE